METIGAWLYDGETALRHSVGIGAEGERLFVLYGDGDRRELPRERLVHLQTRDDAAVYGRTDAPGWRIGIRAPVPGPHALLLPHRRRFGEWIDRIGIVPFVVVAAAISAGVILVADQFPRWAAPLLPRVVEEEIGASMAETLEPMVCRGAGGQAALDKLARQLSPAAGEIAIRVVNVDAVNAATLPGNRIYLFEELVSRADGPEEVAGVLAHELAHVENRHIAEALIRTLSFGIFFSTFGGNPGANIELLLSSGFSRRSEREADAGAIEALLRARISPLATAAFFERVAEEERLISTADRALSYLSTHPEPAGRAELFRRAAGRGAGGFRPPLSDDEWAALADICHNPPEEENY